MEIERIEKGFKYFYNLKPSEFNQGHKLLLTRYLNLLKPLIDWYKSELKKTGADELYELGKKILT